MRCSFSNFLSNSLTHSSEISEFSQLFFPPRYWQASFFIPLKQSGFFDLPMANIGGFSPIMLASACPVRRILLCLPPSVLLCLPLCLPPTWGFSEARPGKKAQTHQHCRCCTADRWLIKIVCRVVSFQGTVISSLTCFFPLKNKGCKLKFVQVRKTHESTRKQQLWAFKSWEICFDPFTCIMLET